MNTIEDRVKNIISVYPKLTDYEYSGSTDFTRLGLDSLDTEELMIMVEDEFSIVIPDDIKGKFRTPQNLIDYLNSNPHVR